MKSKIFIFRTLILVVFLFVITSCDNFLNGKNNTTININLDLSKILKTSRNATTSNLTETEYILKVFAYNAASYKPEDEIENLPLLTQTENKVDINANVKARLDVEIGLNVIFVAKLYQIEAEKPLYAGKSEIIKIKATNNKVNLFLKRDTNISNHEHTFETEWKSDSAHHWHAATCEHKTEVSGKAEHSFGDWKVTQEATEEAEGSRERTCTVCRYTATETIEKLAHTHTFADSWTSDSTYHWHAAICEHTTEVSGKAEHSFGEYVSNNDATTEADGTKTRECSVCGYKDTVTDEGSMIVVPEGFVLIPAGTFQMGSDAGSDNNKPVHKVTILKSFYMGKYEVTQAEYEKYCSYGSSSPSSSYGYGENYPAYYVSWYDALVYCNKRSMAEGLIPCYSINGLTNPEDWGTVPTSINFIWDKVVCDWSATGYRLPTEAEWEYASRAGDDTVDSLTYSGTSDVNKLSDYAWYGDNLNGTTHEAGKKLPNRFGLYDMSGNVWEWCWNWSTGTYDTTTEGGKDPTGASSGSFRIFRGGSCYIESASCAVSTRNGSSPYLRDSGIGFRVVRSSSN